MNDQFLQLLVERRDLESTRKDCEEALNYDGHRLVGLKSEARRLEVKLKTTLDQGQFIWDVTECRAGNSDLDWQVDDLVIELRTIQGQLSSIIESMRDSSDEYAKIQKRLAEIAVQIRELGE